MTNGNQNAGAPPRTQTQDQIDIDALDRIEAGDIRGGDVEILKDILERHLPGTPLHRRAKRILEDMEEKEAKKRKGKNPTSEHTPKSGGVEGEQEEPTKDDVPKVWRPRKI